MDLGSFLTLDEMLAGNKSPIEDTFQKTFQILFRLFFLTPSVIIRPPFGG